MVQLVGMLANQIQIHIMVHKLIQGRIQTVATVAYATVRFFKDNFF